MDNLDALILEMGRDRERRAIEETQTRLVRDWLEANKFKDLDTLAEGFCKEFLSE